MGGPFSIKLQVIILGGGPSLAAPAEQKWSRTLGYPGPTPNSDIFCLGKDLGARCFFCDAGCALAARQFCHDIAQYDVAGGKHHKQVVENICCL